MNKYNSFSQWHTEQSGSESEDVNMMNTLFKKSLVLNTVIRSVLTVAFVAVFSLKAYAADPKITRIGHDNSINEDTTESVRFEVEDDEDDNGDLVVTVTAMNSTLFPSGSLGVLKDGDDFRLVYFTPAEHENGSSSITVTVRDSDNNTDHITFTMTVVPQPDAPVIDGSADADILDTAGNVHVYAGLTVSDPDQGHPNDEEITITLTFNDLQLPGEFVGVNESPHVITGTPAEVTDALHALVFIPFANRVAVGLTEAIVIDINAKDSDNLEDDLSGTITVESVNDIPVLTVTISPSVVDDTASVSPFSITISDPDVGESFSATLTTTNDPSGKHGTLQPSTPIPSGSAFSVQSAVQAISYVPNPNVVAGTLGLEFEFYVEDAHGESATALAMLTLNEVSDPPTIAGTSSILIRTDDSSPVMPFPAVTIEDPDREGSEPMTVTVTVSDPSFGAMDPVSTNGIPPLEATDWLRSAQFVPNPNSVSVGDVEVVVLTVTVIDDAGNIRFDNQTRVAITGINGAPVIVGAPPSGVIKSVKPVDPRPFDGMYVTDDEATDLILTIAMDDADKGSLVNTSSESGFGEPTAGHYVFTNDLAAISNLLDGLEFAVNPAYTFSAAAPGDTTFTLSVSDALENSDTATVRIILEEELQNFLITHTDDNNLEGSLRHAVMQATAGDHITFALPQYPALIRLDSANGPVILSRHLMIKGPGADMLRISGDSNGDGTPDMQIFSIEAAVVMEGLTLEAGTAQTGGAVTVQPDASLTMYGCVIKDSVAGLWGGGIDVLGQLTMRNCLVRNNETAFSSGLGGGGVSLYTKLPCAFINTTFSGNRQSAPTGYGGGGALFIENSDPQVFFDVDIQHCTFAENTDASTLKEASALSVIAMGSDVRLLNSIFANGTGRNIQLHSGTITSQGGNLSDDAATVLQSGATDETDLFTVPPDQINVANMNLGPLTQLEGPTEVYPLLAGSAAIDAGQSSAVGDDQRGVHRQGTPDSGAFEIDSLIRVVINEIQTKDFPDDFIELYVPRDSLITDLSGYGLFVDGSLRHTFLPTAIDPGSGIIVADSAISASGIPVVTPSVLPLDLEGQGVVTLLNPAGQVVAISTFVDNFPELSIDLTDVSLTLAPQFVGYALVPHTKVLAPPFGGWDATHGDIDKSSPGKDTANTVFGADNATPVAIDDVVELGEDMLTLIPVLVNDLDADGSDIVVVTGLPVVLNDTTALGAEYWMSTNPVTGYGNGVYFDPRTSQIFNALPNGVEVSDSFIYQVADVGAGAVSAIVSANAGTSIKITTEGHRLSNGDQVQIYDTDNYDGTYTIGDVTDDTFVIPVAHVLDEAVGSWIAKALRGASDSATVEITVIGANDYPVAGVDAFSCGEEDVLRILGDPESGVIFDDAALYPVPVSLALGNLLINDSDIDTDDDNSSLLVVGVLDTVTPINDFSGSTARTPVTVQSDGHGLTSGDIVVISGYAGYPSYNGEQVVTVVDADTFTIPVVYVDNAAQKGFWGRLDDGNRLMATSKLDASVALDIRVDRKETHLIYNPRGSATLNAISLGLNLVDTFYYAVEDSHGAVSIGRIDITVAGVNEDPEVVADPDSLRVLNPFITGTETLSDILDGLTVVDAVGAASGSEGRADARVVVEGSSEEESVVITDAWFVKETEILVINPADLLVNDSDEDSDDTLRLFEVFNSQQGVAVTFGTSIQYDAAGSDVMDALAQGEQVLDFFRAVITDDHGGFVTNVVAVIVEGVNDTPVSFDDNITIDEDVELFAFDPRAVMTTNDPSGRFSYISSDPNDYDVDINGVPPDNELWVIPTNGVLSDHLAEYSLTNNLFTYYPFSSTNTPKYAVGPYGVSLDGLSVTNQLEDTFVYTVSDQSFIFAENDLFRVAADGSGYLLDVLINDHNYNVRGGDIFISAVGVPDSRGEVNITGDGSTLTYTPEINFVGDETFIYTITDPYGNIDRGRVTMRVTTELFNGDLQANPDGYSIAFGETVTLDVLANDNRLPAPGTALTITRLLTTTNQPHIRVVNNKIEYAATNAAVNAETFSYEVAGSVDGSARVIAHVAIRIIDRTKKLPVQDDFFTLSAGSVEQSLDVMANDFILPTSRSCEILSIDSTPSGTVTIDTENNTLRYTATIGFVGRDIFGYTITDNLGGTGSGTVTVFVGVPVTTDDVYNIPKTAGTYLLNVLENDQVLPGASGSISIDSVSGTPVNGSVVVVGDNLAFTSNGTVGTGTVSYVISDGIRTATGVVAVNTVDDGVYAGRDTFRVLSESANVTLNVLNNDRSLPDTGRVLTITAVGTGVNAPDHGGTVVRSVDNKSLIYTPAPGFVGEETFTYTMTDARFSDDAKVIVKVGLPLIAVSDDRFAVYHEGHETGIFTLPVLHNDSFLPNQGGLLEIIGVGIEGNAPDQSGTVELSADGQTLIYQPNTNYAGSAGYTETFTYEAGDGTDARVEATVQVKVYPLSEGRQPESNMDAFSVARNSTGNVLPVIANDGVMPDTAANWSITDVSTPAFGGVATIVGSTIVYTPKTGFYGRDTFTYNVNNKLGSTVQALVTVKVGSLLLNKDEYVVISGSVANEFDVLGNDGIMPGPEIIPVINTNASSAVFGAVSATTNRLMYTPSTVYTGAYPYVDSILYGVIDDSGITQTQAVRVLVVEKGSDQSSSTITFTVQGVNDPPVLINFGGLQQTTDKQSVVVFPQSLITDVDDWGTELLWTHVKIDDPVKGSLVNLGIFTEISPGEYVVSNVTPAVVTAALQGLVFVPVENRITVGTVENAVFTVSVSDPYIPIPVVSNMTVRVVPVNDPPIISGTRADQRVFEHFQMLPFSAVTITEVDDLTVQPLSVEIVIDIPSHGYLSSLGVFAGVGGGRYIANGVTAAQVTESLRAVVFEPTSGARLSESNQSEVTRFTIIVDDHFAAPVVDGNTTVISLHAWVASHDSAWEDVSNSGYGDAVGNTRDIVAVGSPEIDSGAISLYYRNLGGAEAWGHFLDIVPTNASANAEFGFAVAMQDDLLVVGAPADSGMGSVSIYQRDLGGIDAWGLVVTLRAATGANGDRFGCAVAIYGDTLVVGASSATGSRADSGEVYLYRRNEGGSDNWGYVESLVPDDVHGTLFGFSVAIHGNRIVVGAPHDSTFNFEAGSAYTFARNSEAEAWNPVQKLYGSGEGVNNKFGNAVDVYDDITVVGAPLDDFNSEGFGSVYIFQDSGAGTLWTNVKVLKRVVGPVAYRFGQSVQIDRGFLVVGSPSVTYGIHGEVYVYGRHEGGNEAWGLYDTFIDAVTVWNAFGYAISLEQQTLAVCSASDPFVPDSPGRLNVYRFKFNNGPVTASPIADQGATVLTAFELIVNPMVFSDADFEDTLTLSAVIPAGWLSFDAASGIFRGTPLSTGVVDVVLIATDMDGEAATNMFTVTVIEPEGGVDPYELWLAVNFGAGSTSTNSAGEVWAPTADPDGDGITNEQEYVFGTDPMSFNSIADHIVSFTVDAITDNMVIVYRRRSNDPSLNFVIERSTDLTIWFDSSALIVSESVSVLSSEVEEATVTLSAAGDKSFFRIKVY